MLMSIIKELKSNIVDFKNHLTLFVWPMSTDYSFYFNS